jgi:signal peptidase I
MKALIRQVMAIILLAGVIFIALQYTLQSSIVVGSSMQPNFQEGQRLIISKIVYTFQEPERGDVIVFHPPNNSREDYIKRVIALPHDIVGIEEGIVYVNGSPLDEPYIEDAPRYTLEEYEVPENNYFVLGDNRNHSNDSHNGWVLPRQNIIGKVWVAIWPPNEWGVIPDYSLTEA